MATTLADIKAAAQAKYGNYRIDITETSSVELVNPLRLRKAERKVLTSLSDRLKGEEDVEQFDVVAEALVAAAESPAAGKRLVKELEGDVTFALEIFQRYMEETQAGEA